MTGTDPCVTWEIQEGVLKGATEKEAPDGDYFNLPFWKRSADLQIQAH